MARVLNRSPFLHLYERGETVCALHALTLAAVYGGQTLKAVLDVFAQPTTAEEASRHLDMPFAEVSAAVSQSVAQGLLLEDPMADARTYADLFNRGLTQDYVQLMYVIATTGCNLRCSYCFVEDGQNRPFRPEYLTEQTADRGLETFATLSRGAPQIELIFYGGEPLLNPRIVYHVTRAVRQLQENGRFDRPVDMALLTNGTLVTARTTQVLLETRTHVSVSLDGPRLLHDAARLDKHQAPTFERALRGYRRLQEAGCAPSISCTITRHNVQQLPEVAEWLAGLRPSGVGFNILLPRLDADNPEAISPEVATRQLIKAFQVLRKHGIYEDRVMRRARPWVEQHFHLKDCLGVGGQVVLTPDGHLGPCQAFLGLPGQFPLSVNDTAPGGGRLTAADVYRNTLFDEWRHRFPLNMAACFRCPAIAVCGGGCPYASFTRTGTIWERDTSVCTQAQQILEWLIWDTYDAMPSHHGSSPPTPISQTARIL